MWNYLKNQWIHKILLLLLVDVCIVVLAIYGGYVIKFSVKTLRVSLDLAFQRLNFFLLICVASHVLSLYVYGLYSVLRPWGNVRLFVSVLFAIASSTALLMIIQFFVPGYWIGRVVLAIQFPLCVTGIYGWRTIFYGSRLSWIHRRRLVLLGSPELIAEFLRGAATELSFRYRIHGLLFTKPTQERVEGIKVYGGIHEVLADPEADAIAFQFMDPSLSREDLRALLERSCQGVEMSDLVTLYKNLTGKVPRRYVDEKWLISHLGIQGGPSQAYLKIKRLLDIAISGLLLLGTAPLMGIIALAIKLDSRGPILFKQERLGRLRRSFHCLKFRTMVEGAEEKSGPMWSSPGDPRITRVGRWLRRLRLDELPQLLNVLKGEMSLIGPRPIRQHFADQLAKEIPLYELRFALRPGLTGWAQVNHDYANSHESQVEKFEYDLFYIQNVSLFLDAMIMVMTLRTVFLRKGQ
jgi:exopolysaccharide biosynthesis polyprenyl glycosylphosphotransferase